MADILGQVTVDSSTVIFTPHFMWNVFPGKTCVLHVLVSPEDYNADLMGAGVVS